MLHIAFVLVQQNYKKEGRHYYFIIGTQNIQLQDGLSLWLIIRRLIRIYIVCTCIYTQQQKKRKNLLRLN